MSETAAGPSPAEGRDKRAWAEEVLGDILQRMGIRARLEVKEVPAQEAELGRAATQASISVALFPEEELPGVGGARRSSVVEALQFLTNKIVNRGADKRWVNIGVGAHPEPRPAQPARPSRGQPGPKAEAPVAAPRGAAPARPPAPAAAATPPASPPKKGRAERGAKGASGSVPNASSSGREQDERSVEIADDPQWSALGRALAERSAQWGRVYAVQLLKFEDRVRLSRGARGVADVGVKFEGEGRHRRVVFVPANPQPMPKKPEFPDYDDEDEGDEE